MKESHGTDRWFLLPVLLLGFHLLFRLGDLAKLLFSYPLSWGASNQLPYLFFLDACGFSAHCPYWYHGFTPFLATPPGWFVFTYPLFALFKSLLVGAYSSLLLISVLGFLLIYWLGSLLGLPPLKRIFLFVLGAGNHVLLLDLLHGNFPLFFAWILFFAGFLLLVYYKDHHFTKASFFLAILTALTFLTDPLVGLFLSTIFLGLIFVKPQREKLKAFGLLVLGLLLSSFWTLPAFTTYLQRSSYLFFSAQDSFFQSDLLLVSILVAAALMLFSFYRYWIAFHKSPRELLFFFPSIIVAFSVFFLFPFFKSRSHSFSFFFVYLVFLLGFFLVKLSAGVRYPAAIPLFLTGVAVMMILYASFAIPLVQDHTPLDNTILDAGRSIDGSYIFVGSFPIDVSPFYGYFAAFQNLTTPAGENPLLASSYDSLDKLSYFSKNQLSCFTLKSIGDSFGLTYMLAYQSTCIQLDSCGFALKSTISDVCVYRLN